MEIPKTTRRYLMEKWAMRSLHPLLVHHHPPFFFLFLFLIKQTINWALRKETFPRFSAVCIFWHTLIAFSLYIFYRFLSTQLLSLSLSLQKFFVAHQRVLGFCTKWFEKRGSNQKKFPCFDLFISQVLLFQEKKKRHWGMYAHFIVLTISPQPRIHIIKKQFFKKKKIINVWIMKWTKMGIFFPSLF